MDRNSTYELERLRNRMAKQIAGTVKYRELWPIILRLRVVTKLPSIKTFHKSLHTEETSTRIYFVSNLHQN